jgi:hypothetical protein
VQALVQRGLQRPLGVLVEGAEEVVAAAEVVAAHLEAPQGVHLVVLDSEVLLHPVADPEILLEIPASLVAVMDPSERMDYLLSPMVPVRVPARASRGVPA